MKYSTWQNMQRAAKGYFFNKDTMRAFNSRLNDVPRIVGEYYYGIVSSRHETQSKRYYEIVRVPIGGGFTERMRSKSDVLDSEIQPATRREAIAALDNIEALVRHNRAIKWI